MKQQLLNNSEDIVWLFSTHLKGISIPDWVKSFVITGNEDCPSKIELYDRYCPFITDKPKFTIHL